MDIHFKSPSPNLQQKTPQNRKKRFKLTMKSIMSKSDPTSFSFSRRFFNWINKIAENDLGNLTFSTSSRFNYDKYEDLMINDNYHDPQEFVNSDPTKNLRVSAVSKLRSAFTAFNKNRGSRYHSVLGAKVIGTLFGYRRGHVHFAFQEDAKLSPAFMIELAIPTSILVREMASGLVRIALECEKKIVTEKKQKKAAAATKRLLEEPLWRTYCNGKKCGYATRRECGPDEWKVLKALEPISMGAGVLPDDGGSSGHELEGEVMYMRARFERIVGSKNSEAFYMVNPDRSRGPELSVFLLRV